MASVNRRIAWSKERVCTCTVCTVSVTFSSLRQKVMDESRPIWYSSNSAGISEISVCGTLSLSTPGVKGSSAIILLGRMHYEHTVVFDVVLYSDSAWLCNDCDLLLVVGEVGHHLTQDPGTGPTSC